MEAVSKSDIKYIIKSDIRFDITIKRTTWIGHKDIDYAGKKTCSISWLYVSRLRMLKKL